MNVGLNTKFENKDSCGTLCIRYFIYVFAFAMSVIVSLRLTRTSPCIPAYSNHGTSPVIHFDRINPGYTLIAPLYGGSEKNVTRSVYLLNMWGRSVHEWKVNGLAYHAVLKKNGNLLVGVIKSSSPRKFARTSFQSIQELNWQGQVVWEYRRNWMNHEIVVLPNGNIATLRLERVPKQIAEQIKGGRSNTEFDGDMWADVITEVSPSGQVEWEWRADEHLDPKQYILSNQHKRDEWTHANSLKYIESNPIDQEPAYLVSFKSISKVMLVRKRDGKIIWESPDEFFHGQHDPTLLKNGNLLVFDNGEEYTEVTEIDLKTLSPKWTYSGGSSLEEKVQFYSGRLGTAQRLKNGNMFIAESTRGHLFELAPDGDVVWDMIVPVGGSVKLGPWLHNSVFKPLRYDYEAIQWPEKIEKPLPKWPKWCEILLLEKVRSY